MSWSSSRDNWEKLVEAVMKREQIWQLCHQDSITTIASDFSQGVLSYSSNSLQPVSSPPFSQLPFANDSVIEDKGSASKTITQKLFSSMLWKRKPKDLDLGQVDEEDHFGLHRFTLHELLVATDNFSSTNFLGLREHRTVYKGRLADDSLVAVKRLQQQVIRTELEITSITAHRNVLRPRGFCISEKEQLLVYPYMVNGSVASWLRAPERHESLPPLDWSVRKRIALGAAKGLAYLHHECLRKVIHRDVRAANILLDDDFEAVVADFNLAEFMDCYDSDVLNPIEGTLGHIAPEYLATGKCSVKNDVFGYGAFLLELITARKGYDLVLGASDGDVMLLNKVKGSYKEGKWKTMVDADLQGDLVEEEVERLLQIALICTQTDPEGCPTMLEVVTMLEVGYGFAERWEEWCNKDENLKIGHLRRFTIHELQAATEDFSNKVIIKDGYHMLYKGWLNGSPVIVQRYNSQNLEYYFRKELDIGRVYLHPNLVRLIGFCQTLKERLLVFHIMVDESVESWLRGRHELRVPLTWKRRKEIALSGATGLASWDDKRGKKIINNCDVSASNILLDEKFEVALLTLRWSLSWPG